MGLLHRLIPWAYSVDEHEAYYIGLLISTHVLRNKHVLINKPTLDEQTLWVRDKADLVRGCVVPAGFEPGSPDLQASNPRCHVQMR